MVIDMKEGKENNELFSMVSHDIKSPLNGILGFARLLAEEAGDENHRKMARHMEKAGEDILYLINSVLTMAKIADGKDRPEFKRVSDLNSQFKDILQTFTLEAKAKNISLQLWMEGAFPEVLWDMERLRLHAFNNIISNALKFTPEGGVIRISVQRKAEAIKIVMEDSGSGIPATCQDVIFQPYSQVNGNFNARNRQGHGLGLYNAWRFIASHGGTIRLDENRPYEFVNENYFGQDHLPGARFIIEIPIIPENPLTDFENLEEEVQDTKRIQKSMLPGGIFLPGFDIAGECIPAGQVGGDWYDVQHITERYAIVSLGDISGKGVGASLSMSSVMSLLRGNAFSLTDRVILHSEAAPPIEEILRLTNNVLISQAFTSFATVFFGVIDLFKNTLTYVNCGHEAGFLIRNRQAIPLNKGGGPLGIYSESSFKQMLEKHVLQLEPEDQILIFSDGLSDAFEDNSTLGDFCLAAVDSDLGKNSAACISQLVKRLPETDSRNSDDITILSIRVL
jgi:serine phosphatase RsbU (regulator of sigma subunit)